MTVDSDGFEFTPPAGTNDVIPDIDLSCVTCGVELFYAGRGRKPKYCDNCKPKQSTRTAGNTSRGMVRIEQALTANIAAIGAMIQFVERFDGTVVTLHAPHLSAALCTVAEHDNTFRKRLEKMLEGTAWAQVITAVAGMAVPILIHHGFIAVTEEQREFMEAATLRMAAPAAEGTADNGVV